MPSPIAHLTMGYAVYELYRRRQSVQQEDRVGPLPRLLLLAFVASMLPDIDSAVGVLAGNFGRFHNNATHSFSVGLIVALVVGAIAAWKRWGPFWLWPVVALVGYCLHVVMDAFTVGRGVMAFWPFSSERILSPLPLFYGLHWSDGLLSWRHMVTLLTEAVFAVILLGLIRLLSTRQWRLLRRGL